MAGLVIVILSTLLSSLTGLAVLVKNAKQTANVLYGLTSLSYILLGVANFLSTRTEGGQKLVYARLVMVFTSVAVAFTFYLVRMLAADGPLRRKRKKSRGLKVAGAVFTTLVAGLNLTPAVISDVRGVVPAFGPGMAVFVVHMSFFSIGVIKILLTVLVRGDDPQLRDQAKYLLIGFLPVLLIAPFTGIYLPAAKHDLDFIVFTPVYSAFFVVMVGYAMIRHQLFDIRFYVLRVMAFTFSQVVLSAIYIAPLTVLFLLVAHIHITWSSFVLALVLLTLGVPYYDRVRRWFRRATNQIFFQDSYNPQELLSEVNRRLVSAPNLDKMLTSVNDLLAGYIRPEFSFFLLQANGSSEYRLFGSKPKSSDIASVLQQINKISSNITLRSVLNQDSVLYRSMAEDDIAVFVRIPMYDKSDKEVAAYIVLGSKKSGSAYNPVDVQTLNTVANGLVIALQNAFRFEEIQNFNQTLQGKVEQATKELRRTNEKLKLLDATKDEFISMASHQLRTPLTSVKGYLSMVLEGDAGKLNANQQKLLEQSYASSQRMVYLISDLLNLSRLNTGKFVIEPVPVDLSEVVQAEVDQLAETAKARELTLTYKRPATFSQLLLDETKIHQVVMNFIDNAIYYTPAGGSVTVELRETPTAVEYMVRDTGIGVPKAVQHKLFTKFYRAGNAQQARPDGTGLGLFMAKKVVVAQGGSIIFESEEGKGSTFGFRFSKAGHVVSTAPRPAPQPAEKQVSAEPVHG